MCDYVKLEAEEQHRRRESWKQSKSGLSRQTSSVRVAVSSRPSWFDKFVVLPQSRLIIPWDMLTFVSVLVTCFMEPYILALSVSNIILTLTNGTLCVIFILDTILNFFRARRVSTRDGTVLITSAKVIAGHYVKGMFFVDFLSSLPFSLLFSSHWGGLKLLRALRILRMSQLQVLMVAVQKQTGWSLSIVNMIEFCILCSLFLHWIACTWLYIGVSGGHSWLDKAQESYAFFDTTHWNDMYLLSIYWSVTVVSSVGFGDITPTNKREFICAITCMVLGAGMWSYIIGHVVGMVKALDKHRLDFEDTMNEVNMICQERGMPKELQDRVRDFYTHAQEFIRMKHYSQTIQDLSPALRGEVVSWMFGNCFRRVWYLETADDDSLLMLLESMTPRMYAPAEWIEASVMGVRAMVFLRGGLCVRKCNLLAPGSVWGTDVILANQEHEDIEELLDSVLAKSINFVFVLRLCKDSIDHACTIFPELARNIRKARLRMLVWRGVLAIARGAKKNTQATQATNRLTRWDTLGKDLLSRVHHQCEMIHGDSVIQDPPQDSEDKLGANLGSQVHHECEMINGGGRVMGPPQDSETRSLELHRPLTSTWMNELARQKERRKSKTYVPPSNLVPASPNLRTGPDVSNEEELGQVRRFSDLELVRFDVEALASEMKQLRSQAHEQTQLMQQLITTLRENQKNNAHLPVSHKEGELPENRDV